jgi:hypothetical protein
MVFSLEHDIKVTKNHQNLLPTQSVLVAHTVFKIITSFKNKKNLDYFLNFYNVEIFLVNWLYCFKYV